MILQMPKGFQVYARPKIVIYAQTNDIDTKELELSDAVGEALDLLEKELQAMGFFVEIDSE